jgi:hypothetical protein
LFEWYNICVPERISEDSVYGAQTLATKDSQVPKMADYFDANIEKDSFAPQLTTGRTVFEMYQKVKFKLGKKSKGDNSKGGRKEAETTENIDVPFKKMSIFYKYLPY